MSGRQVSTQTRTMRTTSSDGTVTTKVIKTITTTENGKTNVEEIIEETTGATLEDDFASGVSISASKSPKEDKKGKSLFSKSKGSSGSGSKPVSTSDFEKACLAKHNEYRSKHGVAPLKLSRKLCDYSKEWVTQLAKRDAFEHRTDNKYGENIFMKWTSDPDYQLTGPEAVESWYSEIKDHTFGREPTTLASGHFTQVIWKESKELGVATAKSKSGKLIVVANYDPAGNFVGNFAANVPPPLK